MDGITPMMQKKERSLFFISLLIFLAVFFLFSLYAFINIDTLQDSNLFTPAVHVARGLVLFKDTFFQYGTLVSFLHAFVIKIFGEYLVTIRLLNVFFYALTAVLLYNIWSKFLSKSLSLISLIFWISLWPFFDEILLPWSSVYALVFQNIAFLSLLIFIEKRGHKYLWIAGISTALTFWCRQPVGIFLYFAVVAYFIFLLLVRKYIVKKAFTYIFHFSLAATISSVPFILYFIINGAFYDFWLQSFVFARAYVIAVRGISVDQVIKSLFIGRYWKDGTYLQHFVWSIIPLSSIYLTGKPILDVIRKKKMTQNSMKLFLAGLVCAASWLQYYPMTEPEHFFWADTPIIGLFIFAIYKIFIDKKKKIKSFFTYSFGIIALFLLLVRITASVPRFINTTTYSATLPFLKYIRLTPYESRTLDNFENILVKNISANGTYINYSDDMMIPLLDKRFHSFGPLYLNWDLITNNMYKDYESKVTQYVNLKHPVIVSRTTPYIANYCSLANVSYLQPDMTIHISLDRVLRAELKDNNLSLNFLTDVELINIRQLITTNSSLAISDRKKINLVSITKNVSLPIKLENNSHLDIPIELLNQYKPLWIIISFNRGNVKNCTLYFK